MNRFTIFKYDFNLSAEESLILEPFCISLLMILDCCYLNKLVKGKVELFDGKEILKLWCNDLGKVEKLTVGKSILIDF